MFAFQAGSIFFSRIFMQTVAVQAQKSSDYCGVQRKNSFQTLYTKETDGLV
jgi:hypothetical protein